MDPFSAVNPSTPLILLGMLGVQPVRSTRQRSVSPKCRFPVHRPRSTVRSPRSKVQSRKSEVQVREMGLWDDEATGRPEGARWENL
jgi:hypothetical protein